MRNSKAIARTFGLIAFNVVVSLALLELIFVVLLRAPRFAAAAPRPVTRLAQQLYRHFNRGFIQFDAKCARYDPQVTYTLRPGECTFANLEFNTVVRVNRAGLRDDEQSLDAPEVIVIGDSHAMGWGVQQDETFPEVIARETGATVLNAAVSSYGTVRERIMLDRVDTSRLRTLIVQYSDNDVVENYVFKQDGDRLPITGEAEYQDIVRYYASQRSYYPGKYVFRLFMKFSKLERTEPDQLQIPRVSTSEEIGLFLNALENAGKTPLNSVRVIVLEVSQDFAPARTFIEALAETRQVETFDTTAVLTPADFFVLDDHMTAHGHAALGGALAALIRTANVHQSSTNSSRHF